MTSSPAELAGIWTLNEYEQQRKPHLPTAGHTEMLVNPRELRSELLCPICLDLLRNTMITHCLHRFCQECIVTALRSGNKECPTCRKKLVSKRSLRLDHNFDGLIAKIFPNRDEYEVEQEKVRERLSALKSRSTSFNGCLDDPEFQVEVLLRPTQEFPPGTAPPLVPESCPAEAPAVAEVTDSGCQGDTSSELVVPDDAAMEEAASEDVAVPVKDDTSVAIPDPLVDRLVKTNGNCTSAHFAKFLLKSVQEESEPSFSVSFTSEGAPLKDSTTIASIFAALTKKPTFILGSPLIINYTFAKL